VVSVFFLIRQMSFDSVITDGLKYSLYLSSAFIRAEVSILVSLDYL